MTDTTNYLGAITTTDGKIADILDALADASDALRSGGMAVTASLPSHPIPDDYAGSDAYRLHTAQQDALSQRVALVIALRDLIDTAAGDAAGLMHYSTAGRLLKRIADVSGDDYLAMLAQAWPTTYQKMDHVQAKHYDPTPRMIADALRVLADDIDAGKYA